MLRVSVGWLFVGGLVLGLALGCGSSVEGESGAGASSSSGAGSSGAGASGATGGSGLGAGTGGTSASGGMGTGAGAGGPVGSCSDAPPPGAATPPPPPTYAGTCPTITTGSNTIQSSGNNRQFLAVLPSDPQPGKSFPLVFLWHWLGGDATGFLEQGEVQSAADEYRFIALIPEKKGDVQFTWPMDALSSSARAEEEMVFFDDMFACVAELFPIDVNCVSSTGVSAGALFTAQLAGGRGEHLASIMSLSGGVGGVVKPWKTPAHAMPAMVLWGGRDDFCVAVDFAQASHELEKGLEADGNFVLECIHNCAHSTPPFDVPDGYPTFAPLWMFALDHPYWLPEGHSPYEGGLPVGYPEWCAVGAGNASERVGVCDGSQC
ncbi:MAG: hypothetical protein KC731_02330 [Myxococcales bacterium]|nr:hypothetical protein [Myxococcales bacterium]